MVYQDIMIKKDIPCYNLLKWLYPEHNSIANTHE